VFRLGGFHFIVADQPIIGRVATSVRALGTNIDIGFVPVKPNLHYKSNLELAVPT
jgi:hypothetical protein